MPFQERPTAVVRDKKHGPVHLHKKYLPPRPYLRVDNHHMDGPRRKVGQTLTQEKAGMEDVIRG